MPHSPRLRRGCRMTLLLHPPVDGAALDASGAGEVGDWHALVVRLADRGVQSRVGGGECAAAVLGVALDAGEVVDAIHVSPIPDVSPSYTTCSTMQHGIQQLQIAVFGLCAFMLGYLWGSFR